MTEFAVRGEYITLGQILKAEGIAGGGGDVKHFLAEGGILVNDEPENRRGKKLRPGDRVLLPDGEVRLLVAVESAT